MASVLDLIARPLAPDIAGAVQQGRDQARQRQREQLVDQEMRSQIDRRNRVSQLAPQLYSAPQDQRSGVLSQIAAVDPKAAMDFDKSFSERDQRARTSLQNAAMLMSAIPPEARADVYQRQFLPGLRSLGIELPDQYTPELDAQAMKIAAALSGREPSEFTLKPGETRFREDAVVASVPAQEGPKVGAINPGDYTPASFARFQQTGNVADLERYVSPNQGSRMTPPSGYRFTADGSLEHIPGGPADPSRPQQQKPLPVGALRMMQDARDALSVAEGVDVSLRSIYDQISKGELNLGPMRNVSSTVRNWAGMSNEDSRNYQMMRSSLEKLRNDTLRLNKGVQTEGDAQRAWNELLANVNDEKAVTAQLKRIMDINSRAIQLQQENLQSIESNYGRSAQQQVSPGSSDQQAPDGWSIAEE